MDSHKSDLLQGTLDMLILKIVALGPIHGLLLAGCLIGGAAALTLTGLTRKMLFGITPAEPGIFGLAAAVLGVVALAAGWLPALRASRVDPMVALRHE